MFTPAKQLDTATIRSECSYSSFQRGQTYFIEKRITDFQINNEQNNSVVISSRVKGSHAQPYKQSINIKWFDNFQKISIEGRCSCSIAYNCKHIAAVCLEYQKRLTTISAKNPKTACFDWLDNLEEDIEHAEVGNEFLAYVLKPGITKQDFCVECLITKSRKNGGLNKGRLVYINNLNHNVTFGYRMPAYMDAKDQEIIKLLSILPTGNVSLPQLKGWTGGIALMNMLTTGRLFWQSSQTKLNLGEERDLEFSWYTDAQGNYRLSVLTKPKAYLIHTDPYFYLDSETATLGKVRTINLSPQQIRKLTSAPPVPAEYADQFSQRLFLDYPHLKLPTPKTINITEVSDIKPIPQLKLFALPDRKNSLQHRIKLSFNYAGYKLTELNNENYISLQTTNGFQRIFRDSAFEKNCISQIMSAGFTSLDTAQIETDLDFVFAEKNPLIHAQLWQEFMQQHLLDWQTAGWQVEIESSFQLNFVSASNFEAEIDEYQNNWFEMRFNIEINGQFLPLLPLLIPVLQNYELEKLPATLTLPLGNYEYVSLPSSKLRPFLAVLYEMFDVFSVKDEGVIKLSRFDAASIAELELHSYGIFSFKGGNSIRELGQKIKQFTGVTDVVLPNNLHAELRNYQYQGLNWLQFLREYQFGGILADDMGLGKTLQTLTHLLLEKQKGRMNNPCLIIAPTSLMSNWRREAKRFTPDLRVLILQGSDRKSQFDKINDYDLLLTTYPLLPRDESFLLSQDYYYLILDEAQIVKNPLSKAAKIVRTVKAKHRLCLTGTPMENHLGELWTQFDFLMPGFLGDSGQFKRRYRTPIELHGDLEQRQRLSKRIAPFMLRRTKQDVIAELPSKTEIIRSVALGEKQAMLYETIRLAMEQKVRQAIAEKGFARSHITILDALLKLRQTCCDPRTLPLAEGRKVKESAKLDLLMEMLPELLEEGRRILLFSQFTRMISIIEQELEKISIPYCKLTGQTKNRDEAIEQFKSGLANVFLISLKAGGVGLNLTEADTVIVYDPWWNPAAESQAADRAHRIGQDKPVFVYKLITENTVEEKILAMQERKRALADSIYSGGKKDLALNLNSEDLAALFEPL